MNTTTLNDRAPSRPRGSYGFRAVAEMEWRKLRTVRSTWYIVAVFAAGMIGLAMLVLGHEDYAQMSAADRASFDPTSQAFLGLGSASCCSASSACSRSRPSSPPG